MNLTELKKGEYWKNLPASKKAYLYYIDFTNKQNEGEWWIQQIVGFFSVEKFLVYTAATKYLLYTMHVNISVWNLSIIVIIYMLIREYYPTIIGHFSYKRNGFVILKNRFMANHDTINPWQAQARKTIENIAEKVGATNEFKDL